MLNSVQGSLQYNYILPLLFEYFCSKQLISNISYSYKWEAPSLQQHAPQVLQLSPIQAAGQIYTLDKIIELPATSFQVTIPLHSIKNIFNFSHTICQDILQTLLIILFSPHIKVRCYIQLHCKNICHTARHKMVLQSMSKL